MAIIITFGNFKGGTGKTTNATMVGYEMAKKGLNVLLIDLDPQANATSLYLKTAAAQTDRTPIFNDTLMNAIKNEDLEPAIVNILPHLNLLPSSADFAIYPRAMEEIAAYHERVAYLGMLVKPLKEKYDFILLDIPPTLSLITDTALYMSDYCLIVMQTHERSLRGADNFLNYINKEIINTYHAPSLNIIGILPVLLKNSAQVDQSILDAAKKIYGNDALFSNIVRNMERLKRYDITGISEKDFHDKKVQTAYERVADELLERIEEFEQYKQQGN